MASRKKHTRPQALSDEDRSALQEVLGHINFSSGKRSSQFLQQFDRLWQLVPEAGKAESLASLFRSELKAIAGSSPAFADCSQAESVIGLALEDTLKAYRDHHADLLFHLSDEDFEQPFLLAAFFNAVLAEGGPWDERERIVAGALRRLNTYVGYRPVAVLENGRQMELYPHERLRPLPVYVAGAGVAHGAYHELISRTMQFLQETPDDLFEESHFRQSQLDELAIDVRAHDHLHPVNKRTNYMFGEWDPHVIDVQGNYRRFVIRKIIVDALQEWVESEGPRGREERLFDAAAALCGTMLMAASISGSGPDTHDSSVSLSTLLPVVARRRDEFYQSLMERAEGARAKRLQKEARRTQQPFGNVRQYLNMYLASYGARQVQHRELAYVYARIGRTDAARQQAAAIPAASIRFECEVQCRIASIRSAIHLGKVPQALEHIREIESLLHRGIECGALADPWNFLGFQGQYPLFASREDAIPDNRLETLLELMEDIFGVLSRTLAEAAAQGLSEHREELSLRFERLARQWDQYGSDVVEDLPDVSGLEAWEAALNVSGALAEWRGAGAAAGDISFWRERVERFESAHAYAQVVVALLDKHDHVAAMGLLMQWLSQVDEVGLESPDDSLFSLLLRWMRLVTGDESPLASEERTAAILRMFDYLEANAEDFWIVPRLDEFASRPIETAEPFGDEAALDEEPDDEQDDLFSAAYEDVVYRDSTADGNWGDTLENDQGGDTEFEVINRDMEPRLKFLNAVGQMWQIAAYSLVTGSEDRSSESTERIQQRVAQWRRQIERWERDLLRLTSSVWKYEVPHSSGEHDANVEFDLQLQVKYYLLSQIITTIVCLKHARRLLQGLAAAPAGETVDEERTVAALYAAIMQRDADAVRRLLPPFLKWAEKLPLLYVPFDHGGEPEQLLKTQNVQVVIRMLLRQLPPLGLLREGWHVLQTAFRMERKWRPERQAITEFDRLFQISLRSALDTLLRSAKKWRSGRFSPEELIDVVSELVDPYQALWLKHSNTMRLSSVDGLRNDEDWNELAAFIREYGSELFHASQLTLGNVRAILHNGIPWFLDYLEEEEDPLRPLKLLEDLRAGRIARDDTQWCLETIYSIVVDRFDRFLDYNTTTTQSDYGEMLYCLLDFLRVEAHYDRDAWHMLPLTIVHEMLARNGHDDAADAWSATFEVQTEDLAERHLADLVALRERYGMQMPTIYDHVNQRFIKPLSVNRMLAHVERAVRDAAAGRKTSAAFRKLSAEVDEYLADSWGSGVDVPAWLRTLEQEVDDVLDPAEGSRPGAEALLQFPAVNVGMREFQKQLKRWKEPLAPSRAKEGESRPRRTRRRTSKHKEDPRKEGEA